MYNASETCSEVSQQFSVEYVYSELQAREGEGDQ